jgi:hypothetical protein
MFLRGTSIGLGRVYGSLWLALRSDELEEVLPEDQYAFADLIERQTFTPQDTHVGPSRSRLYLRLVR